MLFFKDVLSRFVTHIFIVSAFVMFAILLAPELSVAARDTTIVVQKCEISVLIMETDYEKSQGLLGYNDRTFSYGGMLFEMNNDRPKVFHTVGMQMPIRIMGVNKGSDGNYKLVGQPIYVEPGVRSITINNARDVLEIPESKYQLHYKSCLGMR